MCPPICFLRSSPAARAADGKPSEPRQSPETAFGEVGRD